MYIYIVAALIAVFAFYVIGWDWMYSVYRSKTDASLQLVEPEVFKFHLTANESKLEHIETLRANGEASTHMYKDKRGNVKLMSVVWPNMTFFYVGKDWLIE